METFQHVRTATSETSETRSDHRIAIVDPSPVTAEMLRHFCENQWGFQVVFLSHTGSAALTSIATVFASIVIIDLDLPDVDGVALAGRIKCSSPRSRLLVTSKRYRDVQLHSLAKINLDGFIDRSAEGIQIWRQAIENLTRGETYFSAPYLQATQRLRRSDTAFFKILSTREQEVLQCIVQSLSDKEIGVRLKLSEKTAKTHRQHILDKLNVPNTPKLIRYGIELGFDAAAQ